MSEIIYHEVTLDELMRKYSEKLAGGDGVTLHQMEYFIDANKGKAVIKLYADSSERDANNAVNMVLKKEDKNDQES